jgi:hypothetical protein
MDRVGTCSRATKTVRSLLALAVLAKHSSTRTHAPIKSHIVQRSAVCVKDEAGMMYEKNARYSGD